jgi:DNA-binding MarR family transcriptional regulator
MANLSTVEIFDDGKDMMSAVPRQPERDEILRDLIDALRVFTVESDVFVDTFARAHNLGRTDLNAVMWISTGDAAGRPITVGELAQRLSLSPAATTALVDRLEAAGHVGRTRDPSDRRRVTVTMHPPARQVASDFFTPLGARMRAATEDLDDEDLARAVAVVRRMTGAVTETRQDQTAS